MCADGLHHGHINILEKAKKYGKVTAGLMTDAAILTYKEKNQLLNSSIEKNSCLTSMSLTK